MVDMLVFEISSWELRFIYILSARTAKWIFRCLLDDVDRMGDGH